MLWICSLSVLVLHETLFVPVLTYGRNNVTEGGGLLGIRKMDKVPNVQIRKLCGVKKGPDKGVLWWFSNVERMERNRIAVYVGVCAGSRSVGRPRKIWIDTVKECLNRGLTIQQARRMAGVCEGESMGSSPGDEPLTLTRCHRYEALERSVAEPTT